MGTQRARDCRRVITEREAFEAIYYVVSGIIDRTKHGRIRCHCVDSNHWRIVPERCDGPWCGRREHAGSSDSSNHFVINSVAVWLPLV